MDAGSPAVWIISTACAILATVAVAGFVALGAYKIGKLTGKLKKAEEKPGVVSVPSSISAPSAPEEKSKGEGSGESDDTDSEDSENKEEDEESGGGEEEEAEGRRKKGESKDGKKKKKAPSIRPPLHHLGQSSRPPKKIRKEKKVTDDDWEWLVYDTWWSDVTYRMERKLRAPAGKTKWSSAPFEVSYEQRRNWPDEVTVKIFSKSLIQVAKKCLAKHHEALLVEKPEIDAKIMFLGLNSFKEAYQSMPDDDTALGRHHLKHLIRFLETEYQDTIVHVERAKRERKVSWALLWAFLGKDEEVYYKCSMTGQTLKGIVAYSFYYKDTQGKKMHVQLKCCDYNGRKYIKCRTTVTIEEFRSEKSFEAIGTCPLSILEAPEVAEMEAMFLQNGRNFYNIVSQGSCYLEYEGPRVHMVLVGTCWQLKKQKADGRVMVDLLSFARMNPGYPLQNAEPPTCCSPQSLSCGDTEIPSDEDLKLAPAVVYGFSFSNKQWGGFDVNGFSEVQFDNEAFDRDLVLSDPSRKQMLLALVSEYLRNPSDGNVGVQKLDPIANKGDGCIFLCYGPPGTGKTLTAESMAEKLHRPLWSISVFELGTTAKELETNLIEILDIASRWRAVLLLDEADIYMEKRTAKGDPSRTAMTAIFLRLLEYYRGVLFLTTNRVASFDDAFCSRISMFLRYHRLAGAQCEAVWRNIFTRAGLPDPDLTPFLHSSLNGREIRNTVRIAQVWAKSSGETLTTNHVLRVVNMLGEFRHDLECAIKDEFDDRSITRALAKVRSMKGSVPAPESTTGSDIDLNGHFVQVASTDNDEEHEP